MFFKKARLGPPTLNHGGIGTMHFGAQARHGLNQKYRSLHQKYLTQKYRTNYWRKQSNDVEENHGLLFWLRWRFAHPPTT